MTTTNRPLFCNPVTIYGGAILNHRGKISNMSASLIQEVVYNICIYF